MNTRFVLLATVAATLAACSSIPDRNSALDQARGRFNSAQSNPQIVTLAPDELQRAGESLRVAEQTWTEGGTPATVDHLAYMTAQRVTIAEESASSRAAQAITAGAAAERDKMRLAMRTSEADKAQQQLAVSEQNNAQKTAELAAADAAAERDKMRLAMRTGEANQAQQQLALSEQNNAQKAAELAAADAAAVREGARLERRDAQVKDLETQLADLNAKKTERGIVVTLGDVLFDSSQSRLLPAGSSNMVKLADFFKRNPERTASIEGHTDSVGAADANYTLSERRANAVRTALVNLGVPADRLSTRAHGEDNPVADNGTAAGRQMNRRVEIVFARQNEEVSKR
ncbi:MAG TPA: OmpA family protein [Burkholderiaceae bacterium]|nr:OmpA family protein [Burkholderiaceae bacterium]